MAIARVGDVDLFYELSGDGPGLPVVLLAGLGADAGSWERQLPALARARRVLVVDNRGMGRSDKPKGPYTTAQMAADTLGVLDAAGIERAHLVGYSLGGAIAQELALAYPGRLRSLALLATFAKLEGSSDGLDQALRAAQGNPTAVIALLMPLVFTPSFFDKEREFLKSLWKRTLEYGISADGFAGQLAAAGAHDTSTRLADLRPPTLVMTGDIDRLVPPSHSRVLAQAIPGARLVTIQGGSHGMTMEKPDEVNAILETWFAQNDLATA